MAAGLSLATRALRHAALGDPVRLAIADALARSDLAPLELQDRFELASNLLAHHLDVLEHAGLISRSRSSGDGRRRYLHLRPQALAGLVSHRLPDPGPALFVCTANSARSQLAAALWRQISGRPGQSAGTHPADTVHPGALAAARRAGVDLADARPRALTTVHHPPALVITVCDRAHEELEPGPDWLHWSIPDPVPGGTPRAFDATVRRLDERIQGLVAAPAAAP